MGKSLQWNIMCPWLEEDNFACIKNWFIESGLFCWLWNSCELFVSLWIVENIPFYAVHNPMPETRVMGLWKFLRRKSRFYWSFALTLMWCVGEFLVFICCALMMHWLGTWLFERFCCHTNVVVEQRWELHLLLSLQVLWQKGFNNFEVISVFTSLTET